jgi:hypothetical protein
VSVTEFDSQLGPERGFIMKTIDQDDEDIIEIHLDRLDEQWVNQPRLYRKYASLLADAKREHDEAKAAKELTEADISQSVRTHPSKYGIEKVTEGAVENSVKLNLQYRNAVQVVIEAKHRVDLLGGIVETLDHRKASLEALVKLRLSDYYAEPRAPEGKREEADMMAKRAVRKKGQYTKNGK